MVWSCRSLELPAWCNDLMSHLCFYHPREDFICLLYYVTSRTLFRGKKHIFGEERIKDASFLTRHPHISQTKHRVGKSDAATQGGMMMKISSLLSPGSGNILSAETWAWWERGWAASRRAGLGQSSTESPSGYSSLWSQSWSLQIYSNYGWKFHLNAQ